MGFNMQEYLKRIQEQKAARKQAGVEKRKANAAAKKQAVESGKLIEAANKSGLTFMQSASGTFHILESFNNAGEFGYAECQSYVYDRPNKLQGEQFKQLPEGAKICLKCASRITLK